MSKLYRPWNPTQSYLLPPSPLDWLPEGHLSLFVLDVVGTLDLSEIEEAITAKDQRGERPYSPRMMLALLIYGYCVGVYSSRKVAKATYEDVAFRVIAGGEHPHFTRINGFRLQHRQSLAGLFVQVLKLCARAGLIKLGHVALDGTKILSNASKHKAMSYERMQKEEARLRAEVEGLLAHADQTDSGEDARFGVGIDPDELPAELQRRTERLSRIQAAKAELEKEAAEARAHQLRTNADEQQQKADGPSDDPIEQKRAATRARRSRERARSLDGRDDDDDPPGDEPRTLQLPEHRAASNADGTPAPKAQRNFTDPDSRIMVQGGAFLQAFNAQLAVDAHAQIIVAEAVTNMAADGGHLPAMLARIEANMGRLPKRLTADSGYFSVNNMHTCERAGVDAYISVGRAAHQSGEVSAPAHTATAAGEQMRAKLQSDTGRAIYARRKVIVEPSFGQIKGGRGFRRFSLRGTAKVRNEWSFVCLTHNLLKLFRSGWCPTPA